jgi:hypothetical protein
MNPFLENYKSLTNEDLFDVIERQELYQPLAVEAAQLELGQRQLTNEQVLEAKASNELKRKVKVEKEERITAVSDTVKSVWAKITDTFLSNQHEPRSPETYIKIICFFLAVTTLYQFIKDIGLFKDMLTDLSQCDFSCLAVALPYLFTPIAIILFWKRKKSGWIMIMAYTFLVLILVIALFIYDRQREASPFDSIMPRMRPETYFAQLLIYGAIFLLLCRKSIRDIYGIRLPQQVP